MRSSQLNQLHILGEFLRKLLDEGMNFIESVIGLVEGAVGERGDIPRAGSFIRPFMSPRGLEVVRRWSIGSGEGRIVK